MEHNNIFVGGSDKDVLGCRREKISNYLKLFELIKPNPSS